MLSFFSYNFRRTSVMAFWVIIGGGNRELIEARPYRNSYRMVAPIFLGDYCPLGKVPASFVSRANFHGSTERSIIKKLNCHFLGQPNTAMGRWITWQITGVHADPSIDSQKVWHGRSPEDCSPGPGILAGLHVLHHNLPAMVNVSSVKARGMLRVFLRDSELTGRRIVTFSTCRDN